MDDTLIDNRESIRHAFKSVLPLLGIDYRDKLFEDWLRFENDYWHDWESGKIILPSNVITIEDKVTYLRMRIFSEYFKKYRFTEEQMIEISYNYNELKGENVVPIDGAKQTLAYLNDFYKILIVTNGPYNAAVKKVQKAGIKPYITKLISSEHVGFSKPMKEYFNYVDEVVGTNERSNWLLIGDSLFNDVLGGNINGIDTCLYAPGEIDIPKECEPKLRIKKLSELRKFL